MTRLRDRLVRADFWTDPELLRWPRDKRMTYQGLWAIAEDSGCLEDDPFGWKVALWASPEDSDITVEILTSWRDEFVGARKMVPYVVEGKPYGWLRNFHRHQTLKNKSRSSLPLPPWLTWEPYESNDRAGRYVIDDRFLPDADGALTDDLPGSDEILQPASKGREEEVNPREREAKLGEGKGQGEGEPDPIPAMQQFEEIIAPSRAKTRKRGSYEDEIPY